MLRTKEALLELLGTAFVEIVWLSLPLTVKFFVLQSRFTVPVLQNSARREVGWNTYISKGIFQSVLLSTFWKIGL
jgi:hypothetical protein